MVTSKMQIYLLLVAALLSSCTAFAQTSICIAKGATENSLDFRPDQVNSYLHPERYKIFLFGEMHNGGFNAELEYHLVTYLNQQAGIKDVFKKMSVSNAWHYNQYLRTGDTAYLANRNMVANYGQWPLFWKRLYAYNSTLPDSLKLTIHGLDFECEDVFQTILELAPDQGEVPASLKPVMDTVKAHLADEPVRIFTVVDGKMIEYDNSRFTAAFTYVQNQFLAHSADARRYFGRNYPVIRNIALNKSNVTAMPKPRNKTMFQAMRRIVQE